MKHFDEETWSVESATKRDLEIHALRCSEEGHCWENCCTVFLSVYQRCRWCGEEQSIRPMCEADAGKEER